MKRKKVSSTILRVYLFEKTSMGKQEGVIKLCDKCGAVTQTEEHFDYINDIPHKIRNLIKS